MVLAHETLSNILGWVSIACWLIVYTPQIIENYKLKSGEGLSVSFILAWLIGDLCSLAGAVLAHLIPTIIILAAYYAACDTVLLFQIYYYRWKNPALSQAPLLVTEDAETPGASEQTPLLSAGGAGRSKKAIVREFGKYAAALLFVFAVGVAAWAVDEGIHNGPRSRPKEVLEWRSQVLGWISAVMYLAARVPQIVKNFRTRCAGLSPFLFVYSICGNMSYVLAILVLSMDSKHILANAAWIAGSTLTVFLDVFVSQLFMLRLSLQRSAAHFAAPELTLTSLPPGAVSVLLLSDYVSGHGSGSKLVTDISSVEHVSRIAETVEMSWKGMYGHGAITGASQRLSCVCRDSLSVNLASSLSPWPIGPSLFRRF
ncbi:PQ-loop-domain-containing protein [Obba rivulosa]|uniref:PQ-loop-domain-containing protein n=1 Tax=Obba rivulosa TaxID=1052685 RepID=A0A8E2AXD0_9APHY|nr:PQ-loop-domain-containing protein [Obba rivulosa]